VHLWIRRQSQAVFYALAFFQLDGFAVPASAQVTQIVSPPFATLVEPRIKKENIMKKMQVAFILLFVIIISTTLACGKTAKQTEVAQLQPTYQYIPTTNSEIVFAGKVVNPNNNEWTNNRLVLVFLKSKEVARAITSTMEYAAFKVTEFIDPNAFPLSSSEVVDCMMVYDNNDPSCGRQRIEVRLDNNLGIADGLFVLHIPNTYELNLDKLGMPIDEVPFVQINEGDEQDRFGIWIDPFNEGDSREFYIPSKNIRYVVMVLPGDLSQLPSEIQQPGSIALLDGNRLVAVDPNALEATPQPPAKNTRFDQVVESPNEFPPTIFPINNCGGTAEVKQEVTQTYIHEIIDESNLKLGIEIPILDWLKIVAEIEHRYGISDKQITTYSTTLTIPAGQNIQYTLIRKQTWESGTAVVVSNGVEISAPYKILKSETFEVANSEQKTCP